MHISVPVLPVEDATRHRAGVAMQSAARDLEDASALLALLRARAGWTSRGLRALQDALNDVQVAAQRNQATLERVQGQV